MKELKTFKLVTYLVNDETRYMLWSPCCGAQRICLVSSRHKREELDVLDGEYEYSETGYWTEQYFRSDLGELYLVNSDYYCEEFSSYGEDEDGKIWYVGTGINADTYFVATKGVWRACQKPDRSPDFVSYNRYGDISSAYWYSANGVIRMSHHWSDIDDDCDGELLNLQGGVASCEWSIVGVKKNLVSDSMVCGALPWSKFKIK